MHVYVRVRVCVVRVRIGEPTEQLTWLGKAVSGLSVGSGLWKERDSAQTAYKGREITHVDQLLSLSFFRRDPQHFFPLHELLQLVTRLLLPRDLPTCGAKEDLSIFERDLSSATERLEFGRQR